MKNNISMLVKFPLFENIDSENLSSLLKCLKTRTQTYKKGQFICLEGDNADFIGLVLEGKIQILHDDYNGNRNLNASLETGDMFAEAFACAEIPALPVDILAYTDSTVMLIDSSSLLHQCSNICNYHGQLIQNLVKIVARKNLLLNQKLGYIAHKTTAEKLLAYLSDQAKFHHSAEFTIPFDRQSLADYLGVERSAMSAELSSLQKKGILITKKNYFKLLDNKSK